MTPNAEATPMFVMLRGAVFHEDGYNLSVYKVAPLGLKKSSNAMFASLDESGKPYRSCQVPGCEGTADPYLIIALRPWPDPEQGKCAVLLACQQLPDALAGDREAKRRLGDLWTYIVFKLLPSDEKTHLDALCNLYGKGRIYGTLKEYGSLAPLKAPDSAALVDEAFDRS